MTSTNINEPNRQTIVGVNGPTAYMKLDSSDVINVNNGKVTILGDLDVSGNLSDNLIALMFKSMYPVGSIYISMNEIPGTKTNTDNTFTVSWHGCTWRYINSNVFLLNGTYNSSNKTITSSGTTGGEATHTLTCEEMPSHVHGKFGWTAGKVNDDGDGVFGAVAYLGDWGSNQNQTTESAGGSQAHNNMPPYITCYMYRRVA